MAGKRTKAQKRHAAHRRQEVETLDRTKDLQRSLSTSSYALPVTSQTKTKDTHLSSVSAAAFFGYDVKLIYQDLFRTVVVTLLVVSLLVVLSIYL